jgi:hypothetical protein
LLHKPDVPTPHFEAGSADHHQKEKGADVFKLPYDPNLYVGELQDEEQSSTPDTSSWSVGDLIHHHRDARHCQHNSVFVKDKLWKIVYYCILQ